MFVSFCVIFCFSHLVYGEPIDDNTLKLELVQILFRHGARTPTEGEIQMLDNLNETMYEPLGLSQLTQKGMIQEYEIGKMLRERYDDFLPKLYKPKDVYAYSSDKARTQASLQLVFAALYPPIGELRWNSDLKWNPIPIHTNPYLLDILIKPRNCPTYEKHIEEQLKSQEVLKAMSDHNEIFEKLKEIYGRPFDLACVFRLYNIIKIHKELKMPLPEWYSDEIFGKIKNVGDLYLNVLSSTNNLKRLNGGSLVKTFLENINNLSQRRYKRKIYLYSEHDKNVHAYLKAHNLTVQEQPDYGATVILETYRDNNNEQYVKLLYWNGEPKKLTTLKLENCPEICPLKKYTEIVKAVLPSDDEMLCLIKNLTAKQLKNNFYESDRID